MPSVSPIGVVTNPVVVTHNWFPNLEEEIVLYNPDSTVLLSRGEIDNVVSDRRHMILTPDEHIIHLCEIGRIDETLLLYALEALAKKSVGLCTNDFLGFFSANINLSFSEIIRLITVSALQIHECMLAWPNSYDMFPRDLFHFIWRIVKHSRRRCQSY